MVVAGIWAIISPWVLGYSSISTAKWNSLIVGLVAVLLNIWIIFEDVADTDADGVDSKKGREQK